MKKVVVLGGGVLGTQIAFQIAYMGFDTTIWLRSKGSIGRTEPKLEKVRESYIDAIKTMAKDKSFATWSRGISDFDNFDEKKCLKQVEKAYKNLKLELNLKKAVADADLVIESMTEDFKAKKEMFEKVAGLLPEKTILATNSSTMLPSKLAKFTGRPEKFLAMHFANSIWKNNTAEIMRHKQTDDASFDAVVEFAKEINMVALPLQKEKAGYLLNSMLIPFLFSAQDLYVNGIAEPKDIDAAWVLGTGAKEGPFQILDIVGLKTAHEIVKMYTKIPPFLAPYNFRGMEKQLREYIEAGKLGKSSGEGFYKY